MLVRDFRVAMGTTGLDFVVLPLRSTISFAGAVSTAVATLSLTIHVVD